MTDTKPKTKVPSTTIEQPADDAPAKKFEPGVGSNPVRPHYQNPAYAPPRQEG